VCHTLHALINMMCGMRCLPHSDDRSADTLCSRVKSATEMKSVFGDSRPNCIIIDEIDGAMGGAQGRVRDDVSAVLGTGP